MVLIVLLLFYVSSPPYTDPPEEYGVAINFGSPSQVENNTQDLPSSPQDSKETEPVENTEPEEVVEEEVVEEAIEAPAEEVIEEDPTEENIEEALKEKAEQDLLTQEAEDAIKIKEAKEKADKEAKEQKEAKQKQAAKEKVESEALAKAAKAQKNAKAIADKAAKAKSDALAKAAADSAARAKAAKAAAAKKAAEGGSGNKNNSFNAKESVPIYPGCQNGNNASKEKCLSDNLKRFLVENFNKEIAGDVGLSGVQSITIRFSVNVQGNIVGVRAIAKHPKLVEEAKRVIGLLPKMRPALQNGSPVSYPYLLPIAIQTGK